MFRLGQDGEVSDASALPSDRSPRQVSRLKVDSRVAEDIGVDPCTDRHSRRDPRRRLRIELRAQLPHQHRRYIKIAHGFENGRLAACS